MRFRDLSSLWDIFAAEPWFHCHPTELLSCTKCAGMVARLEGGKQRGSEQEPEDTLNSPLEQLYDLLVIRALSLCPVNLWVDEKVLPNANWPSPFRNATMALPKNAHMRWGGWIFMLTATQTGNLCVYCICTRRFPVAMSWFYSSRSGVCCGLKVINVWQAGIFG